MDPTYQDFRLIARVPEAEQLPKYKMGFGKKGLRYPPSETIFSLLNPSPSYM